jgi:peptidoglycan/LPS O-acetylase OafA/YrhL
MENAGWHHSIPYRPEIDGLRTLAVLAVVFYHAKFAFASGGYVGVDVFYVISGYLISGIILREHQRGTFSVTSFYERRARRILPALVVVCLTAILFAWVLMLPGELKNFGASLVAIALFVPNVLFWRTNSYFGGGPDLTPMLHTWSLGIEEQFYLFFPFALLLVLRFARRFAGILFAVAGLASFGLSLWLAQRSPEANFYLLPPRAWELLAGALLSLNGLGRPREGKAGRHWACEVGALAGLLSVVLPMALYDDTTTFPGAAALPPVAGTMLLIACARAVTLVGRMFALRPMVAVGLISYGLYLWHQPIFAFARLASDTLSPSEYFALGGLAALLATLSYHFVERPLRDRRRLSRKQVFAASAAALVLLAGLGAALAASGGAPARIPAGLRPPAENPNTLREGCAQETGGVHACALGKPGGRPALALLGDSHAFALADVLSRRLAERGESGVLLYTDCHPVDGLSSTMERQGRAAHEGCAKAYDRIRRIVRAGGYRGIVLAVRWTLRLYPLGGAIDAPEFDNGEGGREQDSPYRRNYAVLPNGAKSYDPRVVAAQVDRYVKSLAAIAPTALIYQVPEVGFDPNRRTMRAVAQGATERPELSTSAARYRQRNTAVAALLDGISAPGLTRVRPDRFLCNTVLPGRCVVQARGRLYYHDDDHLSDFAAEPVVDALLAQLDSARPRGESAGHAPR